MYLMDKIIDHLSTRTQRLLKHMAANHPFRTKQTATYIITPFNSRRDLFDEALMIRLTRLHGRLSSSFSFTVSSLFSLHRK